MPLYFAVFIALVSVAIVVESECSLTRPQARRVLGDGGPWRCGGLHDILEQRVAQHAHLLPGGYIGPRRHPHGVGLAGSLGGGDNGRGACRTEVCRWN